MEPLFEQLPEVLKKPEFITALDLYNRPETSMQYLVEGLIPKVGISFFTGSSDLGKSAFLRQLAVYIVQRQERFCGFSLHPTFGRVLFIASEDDEYNTPILIKKLTNNPIDLENLIFSFDTEDLLHTISSALTKPIDLVIVDCSLDFLGNINMYQANEVRSWLKPLHDLAKKNEFQIVFLTHNSKRSEEREPNKVNIFGSQAFEAKARLVLELRKGDDINQLWLCILKANFLPDDMKAEAHELRMENMQFVSTAIRKPLKEIFKSPTIRKIEKKTKMVFALYSQGLSQRKISEQTGLSLGTVNNYLKGTEYSKKITVIPKAQLVKEQIEIQKDSSIDNFKKYIYVMIDRNTGYYKIGKSKNPEFREKTLQSEKPCIDMLFYYPGSSLDEIILHREFRKKRIRGEWFNLNDSDIFIIENFLKKNQPKII